MTAEEPRIGKEQAVKRIKRLLNHLLDASEEAQAARTEEEMFRRKSPPNVARGKEFHDIGELVEDNQLRADYQKELKQRVDRRQEAETRYHSLVDKLTGVIPEGAVVVHEYGGNNPQLKGRHRVTHASGGAIQIVRAQY